MKILISLDKFKGALDAPTACATVQQAIRNSPIQADTQLIPLTDGGDGFASILTAAVSGELRQHKVANACGSLQEVYYGVASATQLPQEVRAMLQWQHGSFALVEMAQASGLAAISSDHRNPWKTHCTGLGQLIAHIAESGINRILLGIGGSATQDLGLPALVPLGLRLYTQTGEQINTPTPESWSSVHSIRWQPVYPNLEVVIACDVTNPLLGERGTANVFAVQKGLSPEHVPLLEQANAQIAQLLEQQLGIAPELKQTPGAGAAGGVGYGFHAILRSRIINGSQLVQDWFQLKQSVAHADLLITGEGRADMGTLDGKGPGSLLQLAHQYHKPVLFLAGQVDPLLTTNTKDRQIRWVAITPENTPLSEAIANTRDNLYQAVRQTIREIPHF
jgi:glycerate kinase